MATQLETSILIQAPVSRVWKAFSNFESYADWNPFIHELRGPIERGKHFFVHLDTMKFTPVVLEWQTEKTFRWKGKLAFGGLFDGEHYFILESQPDGSTKFIQGEIFTGILIPFMKSMINGNVRKNFESMNAALKRLVEEGQ